MRLCRDVMEDDGTGAYACLAPYGDAFVDEGTAADVGVLVDGDPGIDDGAPADVGEGMEGGALAYRAIAHKGAVVVQGNLGTYACGRIDDITRTYARFFRYICGGVDGAYRV